MSDPGMDKRARVLATGLLLVFLLPCSSLFYYQVYQREELETHHLNSRGRESVELRGDILDREGRVLAQTRGNTRNYPFGPSLAPMLGYWHNKIGVGGLELLLDRRLRGRSRPRSLRQALQAWKHQSRKGDTVRLTVDAELQQKIFDLLPGEQNGAAVVLEVESGQVLASVSWPSYEPGQLESEWEWVSKSPRAPLIERGVAGLYPPGSVFKVMMLLGLLNEQLVTSATRFQCDGSIVLNGFRLHDAGAAHGELSPAETLAYSCNPAFAGWGRQVGLKGITRWMADFHLLDRCPGVPGSLPGHAPRAEQDPVVAAGQAAIGQADILVTPLSMARLACVTARKGEDIEPRLLMSASSQRRRWVKSEHAELVAQAMRTAVTSGTAAGAALDDLPVAGKTGTAENPHGEPHSWFIGFAPADNPRVAIAVIVEHGGAGGGVAAELGRQIFALALR